MKSSVKTNLSLAHGPSKLPSAQAMHELERVRTDIRLIHAKLDELHATLRLIFEHHPDEKEFYFQMINTDRFNRVVEKTGYEELIHDLEEQLINLQKHQQELEDELMSAAA